jgi:hypothetical protein
VVGAGMPREEAAVIGENIARVPRVKIAAVDVRPIVRHVEGCRRALGKGIVRNSFPGMA